MADEIRLDVAANTTPMERDIADATRRVGKITLNANIDTKSLDAFSRPLGRITGQADEFTKSMEAANARVLAFGASVGTINLITSAFKNLIASTNEVEEALTQIKTIGGDTFANLKEVSSGIFDIAKKTGTSFKDASEATLEFSRQGKSLKESLESANAALILTRTTGLDAAESVKGLTTAVNVFNESGLSMAQIVNKLAAVDTAFAVGSRDLIEGISRSASVAQEAGVSFDELSAFITVLQEKTGRGGAVIGNALKTIFTRVQNPEILKDIQKLGIAVTDASGDILPATQIIKALGLQFDGLDKNLRNNLLLKVGGGFQVDKLAAILRDVALANGKFESSLNTSATATDQADRKVKQLNQTLSASAVNLGSSFKELASNIGAVTFSKDFTEKINYLASKASSINKIIFGNGDQDGEGEDSGNKFAQAFLKGLGGVISGPGLALFVGLLGKGLIEFSKFSAQALQTQLNITTKSKEEALIQKTISEALLRNTEYQRELFNLNTSQVDKAQRLLGIFRSQADEVKKVAEFSKQISPTLYASGLRLGSGSPEVKPPIRSANGYIPNLANAISKEKAESPSGSKIIVDHSFPMGGGEKGTMIYNSNETRISNFGGSGGDAIIPNYPINSARGYTPNFAKEKKEKKGGDRNKVLNFDVSNESVAGLTLGNDFGNVLTKAKPYKLSRDVLKKYAGSPYLDILNEFDSFNVTNLPVGNIYKFRKGLSENEEKIKGDFLGRLNSKLRGEIVNFILAEVSNLGLKPGGGLAPNLSNLKLDILGPSTAGYMFEEVLKIPTLTDAEKVAQYSNQSATDFFDIKNLDPNFAEAYGLPKRKFNFAEVKLGQKELMSGMPKKVLNQLILEGGGANPAKFGNPKRAASGYVPNFATNISSLRNEMSQKDEKGAYFLKNYYDIGEEGINDSFSGNARIKYFSLDKTLGEYTTVAQNELNKVKTTKNYDSFKERLGAYLGSSFNYDSIFTDTSEGILSNVKGALAEKDFANKFKGFKRENSEMAGIDFYKNNEFKANELIEIKARKRQFSQNEANAKVLAFLGSKQIPSLKNKTKDNTTLSNVDLSLYETFKSANKNKYKNAAEGYIPNFAGSGIIQSLKEKAKKIIKSPITQTLFDQAVETLLGLPEGFESSEVIKQINFALTATDPNVELGKIRRRKAAEKRQARRQDYLSRNAYKGYTPNFASSIEDAIGREKAATGLPDSMIKVSKDSRARNSSLNPTGFIVTNKVDEPRGGMDVPNSRIKKAYNASKGFVPNFAFGPGFIAGSEKSGASKGAIEKAIAGVSISSDDVAKAQESLRKATTQLTESVSKQKKQTDRVNEAQKKQADNLEKGTSSTFPQIRVPASLPPKISEFEDAANKDIIKKAIQNKTLANITYSTGASLAGTSAGPYAGNFAPNIPTAMPPWESKRALSLADARFTSNIPIPRIPTAPISYATPAPTRLTESDVIVRRRFQPNQENKTSENKTSENKTSENNKQQTKSFGDLATKLLVYQTAISFTSSAVASFGKEATVAADLISTFGQTVFVVTQGLDILKSLTGGQGVAKVISGLSSRSLQATADKAIGPAQRAFNKLNNVTMVADTSVASRIKGAGGAAAVAGAGVGIAVGGAILAGLAYKGLDSILKLQAGSATKTGDAIAKMTELQNKYGVALTDSQKIVTDSIKELSSVDAAGLSGIDFGNVGRFYSKGLGGRDETYKSDLRNELRKTGMLEGGNEALGLTISSSLAPIVSERLRAEKGGKAPTQSEFSKALIEATTNTLKTRITSKVDAEIKAEKADYSIVDRMVEERLSDGRYAQGRYSTNELRDIVRKEIEATRIPRIEKETEQVLKENSPESIAAKRKGDLRQAAILLQTDLLKSQLNTTIEIFKAESQIPSVQESQLAIRKELLQLSSSERFNAELNLKQLQDERSLRNEINNLYLSEGKQKIEAYLGSTAATGVKSETVSKVEEFQSKMLTARSSQDQLQAYKEILQFTKYIKDANAVLNQDEKNILASILKQGEGLKVISNRKAQASAQDSLQKTIIDRNNAAINLQKDIYSATFSSQQKDIELLQKKLEIQNRINDSLFKAANINSENPNEDPFIAQRREQLRNIQLPAQREMQAFDLEKRKAELADRQSIFNAAMQKGASPDQLRKLSESKNLEDSYKILGEVLSEQGNNFTKNVQTAADYLYESMVGTAEAVHKILTEEYISEGGKLYDKKQLQQYKMLQSGEGAELGVMPPTISQPSFSSDLIKRIMDLSGAKGEMPKLEAKDVKALVQSQSDKLVSPEGAVKAGIIERNAEFNNSIAKKYWNLDKQRLENSITLAQRALDIDKQRTAEQLRLEQTQFEGRNLLEFNPLKQRINQANFQQESQIKAAQIEDEQNAKNYLLEARKSALNYMISSGSTPAKIAEVQSMNSIEQLKKALNEVAEENINNISAGDQFLKKVSDAGDIFINKIKEFYPNTKVEENQFAKYIDTSALPTDITELERRKEYLSDTNVYDQVSFEEAQKIPQALKRINEALDIAVKDQEDRLKLASEGIYTNGILPADPYLKTPGVKKQAAADRANVQTQIENETSFSRGIQSAKGQIEYELMTFDQKMGKDIPINFRDGMASALKELSNPNSTEPLRNRLLGVANSFLQKINDGLMQNLANQLMRPLMSGFGNPSLGQNVSGMASGGYIKGGSGSKDDVPAMLMGGEYVVTKSAVQKYGPAFLDSLNKGTIKKYADGGWVESDVTKYQDSASVSPYGQSRNKGLSFDASGSVVGMDSYTGTAENKEKALKTAQSNYYAQNAQTGQGGFYMPGENGMGAIMGQRNLLSFATQQTAGTKFDKISGSGNEASIDLGAGSSNMSLFGLRDQNNAKNAAYLESKQKSLDLYFGGIDAAKQKANREEEIRKDIERIKEEAKKQQKEMIKGILISMAASAATAGIVALGNAASAGWSATNQASGGTATFGEKFKGAFTGGTMGDQTRGGMFNAFSSSGYKDFSTVGAGALGQEGGGLYSWNKEAGGYSKMTEMDYNKMFPFGASYDSLGTPTALKNPNSSFRNPLMNKGNAPFYDRKASGGYVAGNGMGDNVPTMLNGGEFVISKQAAQNIGTNKLQQINSGKTGGDSSEAIIAKLDELVEKLSAVGTLNITVNSDSKGGQQSKEEGGNQDKQTKELARRIKEVVMVVLKDEKRLGGMLR